MPKLRCLLIVGGLVGGLLLAGCEPPVDIPPLSTLAPTLTLVPTEPPPTAPPSPTPIPPSPTPVPPTATPRPTRTPRPTETVPPTITPSPTFTPVPPTSTFTPFVPTRTPLPTATHAPVAANLITNPSFEMGWTLSSRQQQVPLGWQYYSPSAGETMPYPTKLQNGAVKAAVADDQAECQHFTADQLPPDEQLGQSRGLILEGKTVLRTHGAWRASATVLRQTLAAPASAVVRVTGYILAESLSQGKKEDDDLVAGVRLYGATGMVEDHRLLVTMQTRNDVPTSSRHWNRFEVTATVPGNGLLPLEIVLQQNWGTESEWFFIDNFSTTVQQ